MEYENQRFSIPHLQNRIKSKFRKMESKTIKISQENYRWLLRIASDMQNEHGKLVTFDNAIESLKKCNMKEKKDIMDFAGIWEDMTDEEAEKLKKDLRKGWGKWKIPSL